MQAPNQLSFVRQALYSLKRDYGYFLDVYKTIQEDVDQKTGKRTRTRKVYRIAKAVVLPSTLARKFKYDLSYIAANKNFTYGDYYDVNSRLVIIDAADARRFELAVNDGVIFEHHRYVIKQVVKLEYGLGFLVTMTETVGAIPFEIFSIRVESPLQIQQLAAGST